MESRHFPRGRKPRRNFHRFRNLATDEHIYIIVQRPVETKEVHCTATYERKTASQMFHVSGWVEDEHIVINRECGSKKEIICLVDDENLTSVIWTQGFKVDLPMTQSSWTRVSIVL